MAGQCPTAPALWDNRMTSWPGFVDESLRGVAAWGWAVVAATLVLFLGLFALAGVVPDTPGAFAGFFFVILAYIAILSAVPVIAIVWLLRLTRAPRGWGDALAGALLAPVLSHAFLGGFDFSLSSFKPADLLLAVSGAVGGLVYWYFAGRPGRQS